MHFLGIGGAGLSPLAWIHLAGGGEVTGSDQEDSPRVAALRAAGARVRTGTVTDPLALAAEIAGADVVVASSALSEDHPEVVAARVAGVPVRRRTQWLPELTAGYRLVAVAGSHGKTTTSAMLAVVLRDAGLDPTAVVGAVVTQLGGGALVGRGELFVLEADEYGGAFAELDPEIAIVTNVEWEHPDLFPDADAVRAAFTAFARRVRPNGRLVVCGDDPGVRAVLAALPGRHTNTPAGARAPASDPVRVVEYGFEPGRHWRAVDVVAGQGGRTRATVLRDGVEVGTLDLGRPGRHAVANALAALAAATELGVPVAVALASLSAFAGADRRFTSVGVVPLCPDTAPPRASAGHQIHSPSRRPKGCGFDATGGTATGVPVVEVVDDYAHHPTEIRATLAAAHAYAAGRQVWAVVQPHTYSRLAAMLDDFAASFGGADRVYVTDIYASRERDDLGMHSSHLAKRITSPSRVAYVPWDDLVGRLAADLRSCADDLRTNEHTNERPAGEPAADERAGDAPTDERAGAGAASGVLVLTLGAGTVTEVGSRLLADLADLGVAAPPTYPPTCHPGAARSHP